MVLIAEPPGVAESWKVPGAALTTYQDLRLDRTATIQRGSRANEWLKGAGNGDWVYGYDAWRVPLPV